MNLEREYTVQERLYTETYIFSKSCTKNDRAKLWIHIIFTAAERYIVSTQDAQNNQNREAIYVVFLLQPNLVPSSHLQSAIVGQQ
jgi:hypothetical protein